METTIMENQMEKKMENTMETTIMENQMEKKMENEMEYIGVIYCSRFHFPLHLSSDLYVFSRPPDSDSGESSGRGNGK